MLAVTLGDPYSINIEAIHRLMPHLKQESWPIVLLGDWYQFCDQSNRLANDASLLSLVTSWEQVGSKGLYFLNTTSETIELPAEALSIKQRGLIASDALYALRNLEVKDNAPIAVLSAPIDKAACHASGFDYPGQTEYFCDLWQGEGAMILSGPRLRVALATNHCALSQVPKKLNQKLIVNKLNILYRYLQESLGLGSPKIAVCGLNPHAGDQGAFGDEDDQVIAPAVKAFNSAANSEICFGPLAADTVFFQASEGRYDGVLAMYHDQGLAPLKLLHFYDAVNITAGLKHLRVSPDHGPARDHFLRASASFKSYLNAYKLTRQYLSLKVPDAD